MVLHFEEPVEEKTGDKSEDQVEEQRRSGGPRNIVASKPRKTPYSLKKPNLTQLRKLQQKIPKWWEKSSIQYAFNLPQVRSRLEKLMGTNYVSLTDREYMQKLQERILEDYEESMDKRIKFREEAEMERVKNLVLIGKIPLDQAPPEMARHPVMLIESYCNKLIAQRRAKIKIYKVKIPTYLYWDDTPDPPSGLSIEGGHVFRKSGEKLCHPVENHLEKNDEEEMEAGHMMPPEDYDKVKYENALVKRLLMCETVEEMYALADDIIGILKTIESSVPKPVEADAPTEN